MIGPFPMDDPFDSPFPPNNNTNNPNNAALRAWEERQRRQRSVRFMMMFVLMLLLMDGEDPNRQNHHQALRKKHKKKKEIVVKKELYDARVEIDKRVNEIVKRDDFEKKKMVELRELNGGLDIEDLLRNELLMEKQNASANGGDDDDDDGGQKTDLKKRTGTEKEMEEDKKKVYHYPRNATGYYRGIWTQITDDGKKDDVVNAEDNPKRDNKKSNSKQDEKKGEEEHQELTPVTPIGIQSEMQQILHDRKESIGVLLLPPSYEIEDNSKKETKDEDGDDGLLYTSHAVSGTNSQNTLHAAELSLTQSSGRVALQLYSRFIPGMEHLSLIEGLVKLYDGPNSGFGSRRDVLMKVYGVVLHGTGKVSMVTRTEEGRSALVLKQGDDEEFFSLNDDKEKEEEEEERRLRLEEKVARFISDYSGDQEENEDAVKSSTMIDQIRDEALTLFLQKDSIETESTHSGWSLHTPFDGNEEEEEMRIYPDEVMGVKDGDSHILESNLHNQFNMMSSKGRNLLVREEEKEEKVKTTTSKKKKKKKKDIVEKEKDGVTNGERGPTNEEEDADARLEQSKHHKKHNTLKEENNQPKREEKEIRGTNQQTAEELSIQPEESSSSLSLKKAKGAQSETENASYLDPFLQSKYVLPFPYVPDDEEGNLRKKSPLTLKRVPERDHILERNAANCEFEVSLDIKEATWTMKEMRDAIEGRLRSIDESDPASRKENSNDDEDEENKSKRSRGEQSSTRNYKYESEKHEREALVMELTGTILSPNCDFSSNINVTAIRMNWEHTTGKAINYSFFMMLTCLTQIVLLLRQLLHSQAQSTAIRVSLLCIGWQTVLDAILCIGHIFLCLVMQPLFMAFSSVAFFKLLIFCVIEMKYMAIILQARNNANNDNSTAEDLRRQITLLHLRFYVALMFALISFWYIGQKNKTLYILLLYSFWVPQIVQNIITEAKKPLHLHYIYGMSVTRLVAPLYIFAVPNNFLKHWNPDFPQNIFMCNMLILWVGLQACVLVMQGKYGTRFMIPARFLPPKFDYSRPIPPSLLPSPTVDESSGGMLDSDVVPVSTTGVTRNRIKGNRSRTGSHGHDSSNGTTTILETTNDCTGGENAATLDCVICYNSIDTSNRRGYMLAPCDHIFHRECLEQWMEVKMECPICRKELPAL
mmetsp:Transcript_25043/g.36767  ORF Transcript_25043/g.36767 Transcript_25043/m.36767 type:complete len:1157 (-) Transcript_25043:33-3503(-)